MTRSFPFGLRLAAVAWSEEYPKVCLWADEPAVRALIDVLRMVEGEPFGVELAEPPISDPSPLERLVVGSGDGPVRIESVGDELRIGGAREQLAMLAECLWLYVEHNDLEEPGMHTHVDRDSTFPPAWLAPDSVALEVAGWVPDSV